MKDDEVRRLIDEVDTWIERLKTYLKDLEAFKALRLARAERIQRLENALMLIHDHPAAHEEIIEIAANALDDKPL